MPPGHANLATDIAMCARKPGWLQPLAPVVAAIPQDRRTGSAILVNGQSVATMANMSAQTVIAEFRRHRRQPRQVRTGQEAQVVDSVPDTRRLDPHGREAAMAREGLAAPSCWMRSRKIGARHRALGEILRRLVGRVSLRPDATSAFSGAGCRRRGVVNSCHRDLSLRRVPSSLGKLPTSRCGPETRELAP